MTDDIDIKVTWKRKQPIYIRCKLCCRPVMLKKSSRAPDYIEKYFCCGGLQTICGFCMPNFGKYSGYDTELGDNFEYVLTFLNSRILDILKWAITLKTKGMNHEDVWDWESHSFY